MNQTDRSDLSKDEEFLKKRVEQEEENVFPLIFERFFATFSSSSA